MGLFNWIYFGRTTKEERRYLENYNTIIFKTWLWSWCKNKPNKIAIFMSLVYYRNSGENEVKYLANVPMQI